MTFADKLFELTDKVRAALGKQPTRGELSGPVNELFKAEVDSAVAAAIPAPKSRAKGERNLLFDALAKATGTKDVTRITKSAAVAVGQALAEIRAVAPTVTPEQIVGVVNAYKHRWPDPRNLTPRAIAKNWSQFFGGEDTASGKLDPYQEPKQDWRGWMSEKFAGSPFVDEIETKRWGDVPINVRTDCKKHFAA